MIKYLKKNTPRKYDKKMNYRKWTGSKAKGPIYYFIIIITGPD